MTYMKEDEARTRSIMRDDWKSLKLWDLIDRFGKQFDEWNNSFPPVNDDRRLFITRFNQMYQAIDSLTDNPNTIVCCAMNTYLEAEYKAMQEIVERFNGKSTKE